MTATALQPERRVISCHEHGRINLDSRDVLGSDGRLALVPGVLNRYVRADFKDNELRVAAMGVTGLIPLTDRITIQVKPRFPLRNLTHMVSVCGYSPTVLPALREYKATDEWSEWLLDVMADGLLIAMDTIKLNGLLRAYNRRTEVSSYPHGRIDNTTTILCYASRGIQHRAQYSWFERTVDTPPNRCLKSAAAFLHAKYVRAPRRHGVRERIARLGEAIRILDGVTLESRPSSLDDPQVRGVQPLPEARSHYRQALDLAVAILAGTGVNLDASGGSLRLPSLLVKTEDLFEEFVRLSMRESLINYPQLSVLNGNEDPGRLTLYETVSESSRRALPDHALLSPGSAIPHAEPDVVFRMDDGFHPMVADVKYTNVRDYADRSELEQIVLYGIRYNCPAVMTVHPKRADAGKGLHVAGRIGSMLVVQYRVDLEAEDLRAEMDKMAQSVSNLISSQRAWASSPSGSPLDQVPSLA